MTFVRLNNQLIHYRVDGNPDGKALVFSNSLGSDQRIWEALLPPFAERYRLIRYDKRGHGLSDAPPPPYTIQDHIDDLNALLDHLAVDEAIICGVSVGGMIALGAAAARPERVQALVLCDTAAVIGPASIWDERIQAISDGGLEAVADGVMARWFGEDFRATHPEQVAGWRHLLLRTPLAGYLGTCAALRNADLRPAAASIRVPTLVVAGEEDASTPPALVRGLTEQISGAHFELIPAAGHLPCIDQPAELERLMSRFFAETL